MITIGIDPGVSGGIAVFHERAGHVEIHTLKFADKTEADVAKWLRGFCLGGESPMCYLEQVGAAGGGPLGRRQGANSMFTFGKSYGFLRGVLVALGIPFEDVRPAKWLHAMGLKGIKDEGQTAKKNRHKQKAQQLFPHVKLTHATADAILLAEYARRMERGEK